MYRVICVVSLLLGLSACSTVPVAPADPLANLLEPGEQIAFRAPARMMHGHDPIVEPPWDPEHGYQQVPAFDGELAVTDRRLLFVELPARVPPSWAAIPFEAIARARPSRTPLLNYVVVWDHAQHPDAFLVDARHVKALHQAVGQGLLGQQSGGQPVPVPHALPAR